AFWDTEIYMIPYFMQVNPSIAATLLNNRYSQMTEAKEEARRIGVNKGIKFAWRTISGRETGAYFPAGQAQFHINSDIAYAFIKNYQLHKDTSYFITYGLPVLIETARFYGEVVTKKDKYYHIHNVTGPDEYTTLVNDNYYTNSMLKFQLEFMLTFLEENAEACRSLTKSYNLTKDEIDWYQDIAKHMYLPYDDTLGIDAQDDSFLQKAKWHFETTKASDYPLLMHYHPITIYRHQVLKQPDTVLAHYLLNNRPFEVMDRSFGYYEPLTTHDSSLSRCIHAAQAARLGKIEKAYRYFLETVSLDLDNVQGNTEYGLHVANLGGMYIALLNGFLGFTVTDGISIKPTIPEDITSLSMNVRVEKDCIIAVNITHDTISLKTNKAVTLTVYDKTVTIEDSLELPYQR
ncbi:MAG: glycosyl hydrolase family 65 protein, partial [Bacillota bacterium]